MAPISIVTRMDVRSHGAEKQLLSRCWSTSCGVFMGGADASALNAKALECEDARNLATLVGGRHEGVDVRRCFFFSLPLLFYYRFLACDWGLTPPWAPWRAPQQCIFRARRAVPLRKENEPSILPTCQLSNPHSVVNLVSRITPGDSMTQNPRHRGLPLHPINPLGRGSDQSRWFRPTEELLSSRNK